MFFIDRFALAKPSSYHLVIYGMHALLDFFGGFEQLAAAFCCYGICLSILTIPVPRETGEEIDAYEIVTSQKLFTMLKHWQKGF